MNKLNINNMIINNKFKLSLIFVLIYSLFIKVRPLLFLTENLNIFTGRTFSFYLCLIMVGYNIYLERNNFSFKKISKLKIVLLILFIYNILVETLIHNSFIFNEYFISFFFNISLFFATSNLLVKNPKLIYKCFDSFIFISSIISINMIYNSIFTNYNYQRLTFLNWNENELAITICIALSYQFINNLA